MEFAAVLAALAPWAAFVVLLCAAAVVIGQNQRGRKPMLLSLALCVGCGGLLFVGPSVLRQHGLAYRCWPYQILIALFFGIAVGTILLTVVLFCRKGGARLWEVWAVTLSGLVLVGTCLFACVVFAVFTARTEETGVWNGQKVVMVEQGGRYRYYAYRGWIVMGEPFGTSQTRWEGEA